MYREYQTNNSKQTSKTGKETFSQCRMKRNEMGKSATTAIALKKFNFLSAVIFSS
jgi:hypothetical protein